MIVDLNNIHGINLDESTYHTICFQSQANHSNNKAIQSKYNTGNIVYAQYRSYAWWPVRVATHAEIIKNNRSRSAKLRFAIRSNNNFEYPIDLIKKFKNFLDLESINV